MKRRCLTTLVSVFCVFSLILTASATSSIGTDTPTNSTDFHNANMRMLFDLWDYYRDSKTGDFCPPEFYGGAVFSTEDHITFCVTDDTPQIRAELEQACQSPDFYVRKVEHTYLELAAIRSLLTPLANPDIETVQVSISDNVVEVITSDIDDTYSRIATIMSTRGLALPIRMVERDDCYPTSINSDAQSMTETSTSCDTSSEILAEKIASKPLRLSIQETVLLS